ncbi:hypothetical protein ACGFY7_23645 [Streptomyces prunicolor]|uniref:hypothetical protein n=1 Tax=Streptomyces prunicolor TaxID=67348 RepID=UPI00371FD87E
MKPSIGRIVHYTLSQQDADAINKRRADFQAFRSNFSGPSDPGHAGADGHVAHVGNHAAEGDVCPAMVVRVFHPETTTANLQVFLDGSDTYWATSRTEGEGPSHWAWPERV